MADIKLSGLLISNPVTAALTGDEPLETVVSGVSEAAKVRQLSFAALNAQAGATYTLAITDQGKVVAMSLSGANTVTIPLNATAAFPIGATLIVRQVGAGATTIAIAGGVTLNKKATVTLVLAERWSQVVLHKTAVDTWHMAGELTAV